MFMEQARRAPRRIVLPESGDARIRQAAGRLAAEAIAQPVLVIDSRDAPRDMPPSVPVVSAAQEDRTRRYAARYAAERGVKEGVAARLMRKPLFFGAMMVAEGDADAMVAGVETPTAQVISAAGLCVGYAPGVSCASSFFVMVLPGEPERVLVFADCAVAVEPSAEDLAGIAVTTARNARSLLNLEPRVAMLSFSTHGSAQHPLVEKVIAATRRARELAPELIIDGDVQLDAAIVESVARKKCPESPLGGQANVLVFPDLNSGNIGYKLTQRLAGAAAIGPIMQGFRKPVNDLSRGASVDDIVLVCALASLQCT